MSSAPIDILIDKASILEVAPNDTIIGTLSAIDPDQEDTFTYVLNDDAQGRFKIINGNQIALANNSLLDYKTKNSHTIKVLATDAGGLFYEKAIDIFVVDGKKDLLAYYKLDETTNPSVGSVAINSSLVNQGKDGVYKNTGSGTGPTLGTPGILGTAANLGTNGYVNLGNQSITPYFLNNTNLNFTATAWIKPAKLTDTQMILSADTTTGNQGGFGIGVEGQYLVVKDWTGSRGYSERYQLPEGSLKINEWTHVAVTFATTKFDDRYKNLEGTITVYINGNKIDLYSSRFTFSSIPSTPTNYLIGANRTDSNYPNAFTGQIDDVRFYKTPLSADGVLGVIQETNQGPSDVKLSNNVIADSANNDSIVGQLVPTDSFLDKGKHTYTLVDDANGLFYIKEDKLLVKDKTRFNFSNNPNPTVKVRVTDPAGNILEKNIAIQAIHTEPEPNLLAYYKFDEKDNNNPQLKVIDSSGNGRDGLYTTNINPVTQIQGTGPLRNQEGVKETSAAFSTSNYINLGKEAIANLPNNFTVSVWINPSTLSSSETYQYILTSDKSVRYSSGFALYLLYGNTLAFEDLNGGSSLEVKLPTSISANQWTHIAATVDTKNLYKLYVNGVELTPSRTQYRVEPIYYDSANKPDYLVGSMSTASYESYNFFKGKIDELRYYNKALSASEIASVIDKTAIPPSDISISSNVIGNETPNGFLVGQLDTTGSPLDKGKYTYTLLDDDGGKFTLVGDKIFLKDKSLLDYATKPLETIRVMTSNPKGLKVEKKIDIQLIPSEPKTNLKAYYKLDEVSNLTTNSLAIDSSGNGKNGFYNKGFDRNANTANNGPLRGEEGVNGSSPIFKNEGDSINIGNQVITNVNNFTVSAWVKPMTFDNRSNQAFYGYQMILSSDLSKTERGTFGVGNGFGFGFKDKNLVFINWRESQQAIVQFPLPTAVTADQWTQVAATLDSNNLVTLYVNGVKLGEQKIPPLVRDSQTNYLIGSNLRYSDFKGQIDEVRYYDKVLSATEIKNVGNVAPTDITLSNTVLGEYDANYPETFNPVVGTLTSKDINSEAHTYQLIENSNGIFKIENDRLLVEQPELVDYETAFSHTVTIRSTDTAGNSLDKKITIEITDASDVNKVAVFDGVDDYISVNSTTPLLENNRFTMEAWVLADSALENQGIINFANNQGPVLSLVNQTDVIYGFGDGTSLNIKTAANALIAKEWHQLAVSYDGTTLKLYVDGQLKEETAEFAGKSSVSGTELNIGKGEKVFKGQLDDIRIWSNDRSELDIRYNQYKTLSGSEPGLAAYYSFDRQDGQAVVDITGNENSGILTNGAKLQVVSLPTPPEMAPTVLDVVAQELTAAEIPLLGKLPLSFIPDFLPLFEDTINEILTEKDFTSGKEFAEFVQSKLPEGATITEFPLRPGDIDYDEYIVSYRETTNLASVPISGNLGVSGFGIKTEGSATVDLIGTINLTVGYDPVWGAYINTGVGPLDLNGNPLISTGASSISINITPGLSEDFKATGNLGFLQLDLEDDPLNPTGLNAVYRLGLTDPDNLTTSQSDDGERLRLVELKQSGDVGDVIESSLSFAPNIGLVAKTSFNGDPVLPSFKFNLGVEWDETTYKDGQLEFGSLLPTLIEFNDVQLRLGTFISDVIRPVVGQINKVIEPFKPILKFATDDIPLFEQLGMKSFFDFNRDGKVTVIDLANIFKVNILKEKPISDAFFKTLVAINNVALNLEQMASTPADQELFVNLGSFAFDDINTKASNPFQSKTPTITLKGESETQALEKGTNSPYLTKAKNLISSINAVEGLKFPILSDPLQAMYLLTGQDNANLITYDLPELNFVLDISKNFQIWGPLWGRLGGGFSATANLGFGYDTYGIKKWKEDGYSAESALDTLDGFYVNTPPLPYNQIQLRAYVEAGFGLDVGLAAGYIIGGIEGKAGLHLVDVGEKDGTSDTRLRPSELLNRPFLDNFNLNGSVSFYLDAYARLGPSFLPLFEWRRNLLTAKLFEFSFGGGGSGFTSNKYISGAAVFLDANLNGLPDDIEPTTISGTDASYQLNYSVDTYDKNGNGVIDAGEGQLVSVGGTDIYTQLPVNIMLTAPARYEMITPVTTLVNTLEQQNISVESARLSVLYGLGLATDIDLATFNPQKEIENGNAAGIPVMKAHVQLHDVMEQMTLFFDGVSTFSNAAISQIVTKNLADVLQVRLYQGEVLDLTKVSVIKEVLSKSVEAVADLERYEYLLLHSPTGLELSHKEIAENTTQDKIVAFLNTTDPDQGDRHTYTLVNDAGGRFAVEDNKIVVLDGSLLDYETATSHTIRVLSTDLQGLTIEQEFVIKVTDVDDNPLINFNVSSLFNSDVIVNRANNVTDSEQTPILASGVNLTLLTQSFASFAGGTEGNGLPNNGFFAGNKFHPDIKLSYNNANNGNNAYLLESGDFTFNVKADNYKFIHLAYVLATEGSDSLSFTLNYSDGTTVITTKELPGWHEAITESKNLYYLKSELDLALLPKTDSPKLVDSNEFALLGVRLASDPSKTLTSVTVSNSGSANFAFLGATGERQIILDDPGADPVNPYPDENTGAEPNIAPLDTAKWARIRNLINPVSRIIATGNQKVEDLMGDQTIPLDDLLYKVSDLQNVLLGGTGLDLQQLAAGEKILKTVVEANSSEGLDQQVADINDLTKVAVVGTPKNDNLTSLAETPLVVALEGNDTLNGLETSDQLFGEKGNDILISNGGIDLLNGGDGNDRYVLKTTSGGTTIVDSSGRDTVTGLNPVLKYMHRGIMGFGRSDTTLFIDLNKNGELDFQNDVSFLYFFADAPSNDKGTGFIEKIGSLDGADVLELMKNHAPTLAKTVEDKILRLDSSFTINFERDTFKETDPGDYVVYTVLNADGSPLPNWLQFDGGTLTLTGQPTKSELGNHHLILRGTDQGELYAETPFTLTVPKEIYGGTPNKDQLVGTAKNDVLDGGLEADTLIGKQGNDVYHVDNKGDLLIEKFNQGTDLVYATVNYTLNKNLENLTLLGNEPLKGEGNEADNIITGNEGNNQLYGRFGADTMIGGAGNDSYYVDNKGDQITENFNEGVDTVHSSLNYTLGDNLENLTLLGTKHLTGIGNQGNNIITGNNGNNRIEGQVGADTLNGGAGNDTLSGGSGNDSINGGAGNDTLIETANVNFTATQGTLKGLGQDTFTNIETLRLTGGNGDNTFDGSALTTTRVVLTGGKGNDTFLGGGSNNDVIQETADVNFTATEGTLTGNGIDTFTNIETLELTGGAGDNILDVSGLTTTQARLYGQEGDDILIGGGSNDTLHGGAGNDTLFKGGLGRGNDTFNGGQGNDKIFLNLDTLTDTINYGKGGGSDTVFNFVRGEGGDVINFDGLTDIDVRTGGSSTEFRVHNSDFGSGELLLTTQTRLTAADVNVNLKGANFFFS